MLLAFKAAFEANHGLKQKVLCTSIKTIFPAFPCSNFSRFDPAPPYQLYSEIVRQGKSYEWRSVQTLYGEKVLSSSLVTFFKPSLSLSRPPFPYSHNCDSTQRSRDDQSTNPEVFPQIHFPYLSQFDIRKASPDDFWIKRKQKSQEDIAQDQLDLASLSQLASFHDDADISSHSLFFHTTSLLFSNQWIQLHLVKIKGPHQNLLEGQFRMWSGHRIATVFVHKQPPHQDFLAASPTTYLQVNPHSNVQRHIVASHEQTDFGWGNSYGGQLMAQALFSNASVCSSFQALFLQSGRAGLRTNHATNMMQQHSTLQRNQEIFRVQFSTIDSSNFHVKDHDVDFNVVVVKNDDDNNNDDDDLLRMPKLYSDNLFAKQHIQYETHGQRFHCHQHARVRVSERITSPVMQQALLSYVCDSLFASPILGKHNLNLWKGQVRIVSFSCTFFYLAEVNLNKWVYMKAHCPVLEEGRAFVTIDFFNDTHQRIAFAVQDLLVRL